MRKNILWCIFALSLFIVGCSRDERPYPPDPRFAETYEGLNYSIPIKLSHIFSADTAIFTL